MPPASSVTLEILYESGRTSSRPVMENFPTNRAPVSSCLKSALRLACTSSFFAHAKVVASSTTPIHANRCMRTAYDRFARLRLLKLSLARDSPLLPLHWPAPRLDGGR